MDNYDFVLKGANVNIPKKTTDNEIKSNKCDSSRADLLRTHLKTHSGEKLNKCNQCEYVSSVRKSLRRHFKIHSGENPNKCNQCDFASSDTG